MDIGDIKRQAIYGLLTRPIDVLELIAEVERLSVELAASQAREKERIEALSALVRVVENSVCSHEETYRGGSIWEICSACGAKWADDQGGKPEFKWPEAVTKARELISHETDDTALREMLARAQEEMRERIAVWHATTGWMLDEADVTDAIRALEVKP